MIWVATLESGVHPTIAGVALGLMTPAYAVRGRMVLEELEHRMHPFTTFLVLPLFALANAGVALGGSALSADAEVRVAVAVAFGLIVGKLLGIGAMTWAAVKTGLGHLPEGVDARTALGVAALGGVGFTVSLFIAPLAYPDAGLADSAKIGVLCGSIVSAALGVAILAGGAGTVRRTHARGRLTQQDLAVVSRRTSRRRPWPPPGSSRYRGGAAGPRRSCSRFGRSPARPVRARSG